MEDRPGEREEAGRVDSREEELKRRNVKISHEHEGNRADAEAGAPEAERREMRNRR